MSLYRRIIFSVLPVLAINLAILLLIDGQRQVLASETTVPVNTAALALLKQSAIPLRGLDDNQAVIDLINNKPLVLIGDSTHGTHEFYQQRINITKRLIKEKNFKAIFLEGDWPNVYRLNQYVQSLLPVSAQQAILAYKPQGAWLWHYQEVLEFLQWLKKYNQQLPPGETKVSLHGMDIYSFSQSKQWVIDYLSQCSPDAAQQAIQRYQCFTPFNNDLHQYGRAVKNNRSLSCEASTVAQYLDFASNRISCANNNANLDQDAYFHAQQNARVVKNSEKSLRIQYLTGNDFMSWNERDLHMMETFIAVTNHLNFPRAIIWAHNSHLGDARATDMAQRQQFNQGQFLRENFPEDMFSIGMLTNSGTVWAADEWHLPGRVKTLLNAHPDSNEALLHALQLPHFLINLRQSPALSQVLNTTRLQRHVGVIYKPQDEMASHYSATHLAEQFDAIIYIDTTSAVTPVAKQK